MSEQTNVSPMQLLLDYQARGEASKTLAGALDEQERWSGIGFRLNDYRLLVSMEEVTEILDPPICTRVPGAKPWFLGLANVRGSLLPVTDLHGFIFGGKSGSPRNSRVLVHVTAGLSFGLKVDDILGMENFAQTERTTVQTLIAEPLAAFVVGMVNTQHGERLIISLNKLASSAGFLQVAK